MQGVSDWIKRRQDESVNGPTRICNFTSNASDEKKISMGGRMAWLYLLAAALFEIGWIYSLKFTEGFTRFWPTVSYGFFGIGSVIFLSFALRYYPVGITYAIWVGIAAAGSNIVGILFLGEPYRFAKILFLLMIIGGVVGLRFSSVK
jgi:quaternary ammonium compound-resistance protein SugE